MQRLTEFRHRLNFPFIKLSGTLPRRIAMTDDNRGPDPLELAKQLPSNAGLLFRHYANREREKLAGRVIQVCRDRGIFCLVAGDIHLAQSSGANGVHLPEHRLMQNRSSVIRYRAQGGIVTSSAHSLRAAVLADRFGVDALFISPVFPTKSHPNTKSLGLSRFAALTRPLSCSVFGLGGINENSAQRLYNAGAYGIAGISLFQS